MTSIPRTLTKIDWPRRGDMLLFTTNFWPMKGTRGFYRAGMRRGVSEVHTGRRHALGILFHDALS